MIVAFDTYYYNGFSYTVGGVFKTWGDKNVSYFVTSKRTCIDSEYISGELYKRELPCIMQCLDMLNIDDIELIIVDGFVWLSEDGKTLTKGLGERLNDAIFHKYGRKKIIVGIAKNKYHVDIPECEVLVRGLEAKKPLYITCSDTCFTSFYASQIKVMYGDYRIPNIIKAVDMKTRELGRLHEEEIEKELTEEDEYNTKKFEFDMTDLDEWAEKELEINPTKLKMEQLEEWIADCEKNGFKYR